MPTDAITPWVMQGGAVGLLLAAMWLVLTGRILARSTLQDVRSDRDLWRATAETALKANAELSGHVGRLVDTADQLVTSQRETQALVRQLVASLPAGPGGGVT